MCAGSAPRHLTTPRGGTAPGVDHNLTATARDNTAVFRSPSAELEMQTAGTTSDGSHPPHINVGVGIEQRTIVPPRRTTSAGRHGTRMVQASRHAAHRAIKNPAERHAHEGQTVFMTATAADNGIVTQVASRERRRPDAGNFSRASPHTQAVLWAARPGSLTIVHRPETSGIRVRTRTVSVVPDPDDAGRTRRERAAHARRGATVSSSDSSQARRDGRHVIDRGCTHRPRGIIVSADVVVGGCA